MCWLDRRAVADSYTPNARDLLGYRVVDPGGVDLRALRTTAMSAPPGSGSVAAVQPSCPGEGWRMGMNIRRGGVMAVLGVGVALAAGCTTPGIVRVSGDTYRVSRADPGHVFADEAAMKAAAVADADAFARSRGMAAAPVSFVSDTLAVGHLMTLDYEFRLVPPNSPSSAATVPAAAASASTPVAATGAPPARSTLPAAPASPSPASMSTARHDYVDELIRLDDLRKRGILTDDEFQTLKAKILSER